MKPFFQPPVSIGLLEIIPCKIETDQGYHNRCKKNNPGCFERKFVLEEDQKGE